MSKTFLAYITPVTDSGAHPEHPIEIPPPHPGLPPVDGAHPEHPIFFPPKIWGGGNVPMPDNPIANVPGSENPDAPKPPSEGHPEHPIYWPPKIWGGGGVPMPDNPIANVPGSENPDAPGTGGGRPPHVEHPIPPIPAHPIILPIPKPEPPDSGNKPMLPVELPPGTYCVQIPVDDGSGKVYWEWVCFVPGGSPDSDKPQPKKK